MNRVQWAITVLKGRLALPLARREHKAHDRPWRQKRQLVKLARLGTTVPKDRPLENLVQLGPTRLAEQRVAPFARKDTFAQLGPLSYGSVQ